MDGILAHLRYHRAGAARSGVEAAPYIDNLVLRGGAAGDEWRAGRWTRWWPGPNEGSS